MLTLDLFQRNVVDIIKYIEFLFHAVYSTRGVYVVFNSQVNKWFCAHLFK